MQTKTEQIVSLEIQLRRLLAVVFLTLLLSIVLTPLVMTVLQSIIAGFAYPFSRVFDRVVLVSVVFSIWIFFFKPNREQGAAHPASRESSPIPASSYLGHLSPKKSMTKTIYAARATIGLIAERDESQIRCGSRASDKYLAIDHSLAAIKDTVITYSIILLLGIVSTILIAIPSVHDGDLYLRGVSSTYFWQKLALILPGALVTALIEELIFRRFLLGSLLTMGLRTGFSIVIVSLIFALVHFIFPMKSFEYNEFNPWAGFDYLCLVLGRFSYPQLYHGVFGMFLVGCCLGSLFTLRHSIIPGLLLHAGLIIGIKTTFFSTRMAPELEFDQIITRRYILISTPSSWLVIICLGILSSVIYLHSVTRRERGEEIE